MHDIKLKILERSDDLSQISNLFNTLYPKKPIRKDYIFWRYLDNPFGNVTFILKDKNRIIGIYSSCIFESLINSNPGKIGFLYDLMIDPKYQNRGLFLMLYNAVLNSTIKKKPYFLYGLTNNLSTHMYIKYLGWKIFKKISLYFNTTKKLKRILAKMDFESVQYNTNLEKNIADLSRKALVEEDIHTFVIRSKKFLVWRSKQIHGKNYRLYSFYIDKRQVGFCLFKFFKEDGNITADLIDLISYQKKYFFPILYIVCTLIEKSNTYNLSSFGFGQLTNKELEKLGFRQSDISWNVIIKNLGNNIPQDFYINMLDTEMF